MLDDLNRKNAQIRVKINFGEHDDARKLLAEILPKGNSETYYLASLLATSDEERYRYLETAIAYDDTNEQARKAFTELKKRNPNININVSSYDPRKAHILILTITITIAILALLLLFGLSVLALAWE